MIDMKNINDLSKVELMLRGLVYAYETKDKKHPNHPFPMGNAYLQHKMTQAKELMNELGIPPVESDF